MARICEAFGDQWTRKLSTAAAGTDHRSHRLGLDEILATLTGKSV